MREQLKIRTAEPYSRANPATLGLFMKTEHTGFALSHWWHNARRWCAVALLAAATLGAAALSTPSMAADSATGAPLRIGIIGAGKMGATLASLWADAGYQVMISSRNPDALQSLTQSIGHGVKAGTAQSAAEFGNVVVIAVPYGEEPKLGQDLASQLAGKVVIDLGNPYPGRDGPMAEEARREGTGVASAKFFPGVRLVRAFNAISFVSLRKNAHRTVDPVAIPIAADDRDARAVTERLVRAAGFAPVVVGPLSTAKTFDPDTAVYVKDLTVSQTRAALGLPK
jgi:predicted dinucleotide-binding enzyme